MPASDEKFPFVSVAFDYLSIDFIKRNKGSGDFAIKYDRSLDVQINYKIGTEFQVRRTIILSGLPVLISEFTLMSSLLNNYARICRALTW